MVTPWPSRDCKASHSVTASAFELGRRKDQRHLWSHQAQKHQWKSDVGCSGRRYAPDQRRCCTMASPRCDSKSLAPGSWRLDPGPQQGDLRPPELGDIDVARDRIVDEVERVVEAGEPRDTERRAH